MRWQPLLLILAGLAPSLPAQSPTVVAQVAVDSGDRVRLRTVPDPSSARVGIVVALVADTLRLRFAAEDTLTSLAYSSILRLERSIGKRRNGGVGALIGGAIGLGAGLVIGYSKGGDRDGIIKLNAPEAAILEGVILGELGMRAGSLVGLAIRTEHWRSIAVPRRNRGA